MKPSFISLFTGIGGIDLAFEAAGWRCVAQVEINDFAQSILNLRWPDVPKYRDVRAVTGRGGKGWRRYHQLPAADCLVGGFPCQDISIAGRGAGIRAGTRSGLWFEYARLIGELRPRLVLLENVAAILARDGDIVVGTLAEMGYDARWGLIRAFDAGATHLRERWFCVAHAMRNGPLSVQSERESKTPKTNSIGASGRTEVSGGLRSRNRRAVAGTDQSRLAQREGIPEDDGPQQQTAKRDGSTLAYPVCESRCVERRAERTRQTASIGVCDQSSGAESRLGGSADGLSAWMVRSYDNLHVAGIGQPQHAWEPPRITDRRDNQGQRLMALGNAVVPQVVYPLAVMMREWLEQGCE